MHKVEVKGSWQDPSVQNVNQRLVMSWLSLIWELATTVLS